MFPLAHFLRQELRDAPGRASYTLRLTLSCAVLITLFMTLQIPFLAVALIVVFYVSQPNVLMIKLVSVVFFVTVSVALGGVLLIIKWTYDYPLIRLAASVALFFCAIYLMRVLGKLGLAFFVVALAVIYAQTFPSMTSQSEILVRLLLWLWVAINTAILVTLLVNACFQQAFPGNQFKARLAEMLQSGGGGGGARGGGGAPPPPPAPPPHPGRRNATDLRRDRRAVQPAAVAVRPGLPGDAGDRRRSAGLALAAGRHPALLPAGGAAASGRGR